MRIWDVPGEVICAGWANVSMRVDGELIEDWQAAKTQYTPFLQGIFALNLHPFCLSLYGEHRISTIFDLFPHLFIQNLESSRNGSE